MDGTVAVGTKPQNKRKGKPGKSKTSKTKGKKTKSKNKSKSKKKGGIKGCCRNKKKGKKSKGSKSKTTKKQPQMKPVKPLAPVPNEQLGEIVLVKDKPKMPPKRPIVGPPKARVVSTPSKETDKEVKVEIPKESQELAKGSKEESKEMKLSKEPTKEQPVMKELKEIPKKKLMSKEKEDEDGSGDNGMKDKWMKLAKRFIEEDANIASNDFEQVAGYIPHHVTKRHFTKNMRKNRFADVVCLDHSRVHLHDNSYIHASWVEVDGNRKAILTQFPLPHTAADFWQMVIEQKVKCILLLLTDQEYDKRGGDFVFPQNQDFLHFEERSIRVGEFKQVEIGKGWNLKVLNITNGNYKSFLHVHHYKLWGHNSIPNGGVKQMWQLQSVLRKYSNPPVYMSLSGCGRAGSYALFESSHALLHGESPFDMIKCLEGVRNGRLHSVQNITQFSFVYSLVAEHILGNGFCKLVKKNLDDEADAIQSILRQLTITP